MQDTNACRTATSPIEMSRFSVPMMKSIKEAAKITGIAENTIRQSFLSGEIVGIRCGGKNGKILINIDMLIVYLNSHTESHEQESNYTRGQIRPIMV